MSKIKNILCWRYSKFSLHNSNCYYCNVTLLNFYICRHNLMLIAIFYCSCWLIKLLIILKQLPDRLSFFLFNNLYSFSSTVKFCLKLYFIVFFVPAFIISFVLGKMWDVGSLTGRKCFCCASGIADAYKFIYF